MLVFLLDCLRCSKLLKLHQTEGRISSNLLKRKQSSKKTSIVCRWHWNIIILERARVLVLWNDKEDLKCYLCFFPAQRYDPFYDDPVRSQLSSIYGSGSLGHGANAHNHSQRPVPRGFSLFKRCKWLVGNWTVSIWTSLIVYHACVV